MKKWLIWCLTVLAMVCLIPGIALNVKAAETVQRRCARCGSMETREILGYRKYDSTSHRVYVTECQNCHNDGNVTYLTVHTGGTQGPTCTTGKICEKCGAKYDIHSHVWGEWTPNGNGTHTRRCTNPNCNAVENASCGGDSSATCISPGTCTTCGGRYDGDHKWTNPANSSLGNGTHRIICLRCGLQGTASCTGGTATCTTKAVCEVCKVEYGEKDPNNHALEHRAAKAPTCTKPGWNAYEGCTRRGCGYTTYRAIPALKHDLVQHKAKAPTCTEKGWNAYETCSRCDYTTYTELTALNHDLEQHAAQAPTCTEIGWNAYEACKNCNYTTRKELPAQHDLEQHAAKAATCTKPGWNTYETCSRCNYTTYAELPALNHDYQAVTVEPTCETDGYTVFTCSRCKDSYTADPTDKLGHQFGAWSPNGTGSQSADCLRQGCAHTGSTDCRKFTFRTAEGETLTFCPVCGQAENAAQLEKIDAATAWALSGSLSAEDVTARTNGEYLSVAFETAGSLTQPTGRVRLALPAGLLEGKKLVRIAPDGTQTELPFEAKNGKLIFTLDFANSELPVMLFRLLPQTAAL